MGLPDARTIVQQEPGSFGRLRSGLWSTTTSHLHLWGLVCNNEQEKSTFSSIFSSIFYQRRDTIHSTQLRLIIPRNLYFVRAEFVGDNAPQALGCSCTTHHAPIEAGSHNDCDCRSALWGYTYYDRSKCQTKRPRAACPDQLEGPMVSSLSRQEVLVPAMRQRRRTQATTRHLPRI